MSLGDQVPERLPRWDLGSVVGGLQTANQLVGSEKCETCFFTCEVPSGRTELSLSRAISKRCSLSNGHGPRG